MLQSVINFRVAKDTTVAVVQDEILSFMEGYPGDLYEEPFVDFSTTRNYALQVRIPAVWCTSVQKRRRT